MEKKAISLDIYQAQGIHGSQQDWYYAILEEYSKQPRESKMQQLEMINESLNEIERAFPALKDGYRNIVHTSLIV